jgi:hypothetical protein
VHSGKVVDEHLVASQGQPRAPFDMLKFVAGEYVLRVQRGMQGRVALATGIVDLAALPAQSLRLGDEARGRIVLGATTILFQFVDPPPPATRPRLPLSVQGGAGIDWTLTVLVAFSFMMHFGFIGAMYSDWLDAPVVGDTVQGLVDMTTSLPPAPVEEDKLDPIPANTAAPTTNAPVAAANTNAHAPSAAARAADRSAALAQEARAMQMGLLTSFTGPTSVGAALDRSNIPLPDMGTMATSEVGVTTAGGDLHLSKSNGVSGQPQHGQLDHLGVNDANGDHTSGVVRTLDGPKVDFTFHLPPDPTHNFGAEATIARLRPSFRSCYNKGLDRNPNMAGTLEIVIDIAPNGDVTSATKGGGSGLSPDVEACMLGKVSHASFDAPGGAGAKLRVPITVVRQ